MPIPTEYLILLFAIAAVILAVTVYVISRSKDRARLSRGTDREKHESEHDRLEKVFDEACDALPNPDEIPLVETRVSVEAMECGVYVAGYKSPHNYMTFVVKFRTDSGELLEFQVEEELYRTLSEGETGTLGTLNGFFYGFVPDGEDDDPPAASEESLKESAEEQTDKI